MVFLLYGAMRAAGKAGPLSTTWFTEPAPVRAPPRTRKTLRARLADDGVTSARAVIASSLFFVFLATALLVGGHAAIDPLLRSVIAARDAKEIGAVVYTMPDGKFCRHMSFDNQTAEIVEGALEPCTNDISRDNHRSAKGFAWGQQ
jgi:hypothetical protein